MSKGQRGNKEAKKPKRVPAAVPPQPVAILEPPATARAILQPRPGKR
jgi:hypothetical protein